MTENDSESVRPLVVGSKRDGRRRYDKQAKRELVKACLEPGVSVARMALEHGLNANLLRKWITQYLLERERSLADETPTPRSPDQPAVGPAMDNAASAAPMPATAKTAPAAFVPIVAAMSAPVAASSCEPALPAMALALHVRLPNGVQFDLNHASLQTVSGVIHLLGSLPCSGSTQR
jgi:transposase